MNAALTQRLCAKPKLRKRWFKFKVISNTICGFNNSKAVDLMHFASHSILGRDTKFGKRKGPTFSLWKLSVKNMHSGSCWPKQIRRSMALWPSTEATKHAMGFLTSVKKRTKGQSLSEKKSELRNYYTIKQRHLHQLTKCNVCACSCKGLKIKTRLYGAIWHGAFMACFAYNAHLEGGSNVQVVLTMAHVIWSSALCESIGS